MEYIKMLLRLLSAGEKRFLLANTLFMIIFAVYGGIAPYILKVVIDYGVSGNLSKLALYSSALLIMTGIVYAINYLNSLKSYHIVMKLSNSIRNSIANVIRRTPLSNLEEYTTGDMITRYKDETENSVGFIYSYIYSVLTNGIKLPVMIYFCIRINWQLTLAIFVTTPLIIILTSKMSAKLAEYNRERQESISNVVTNLKENLVGAKNLRFFPHKYQVERFTKLLQRYYDTSIKLRKRNLLIKEVVLSGLTQLISVSVVCIAAYLVSKSIITVGSIMAIFVYVFNIWDPIGGLLSAHTQYKQMKSSIERVQEILKLPQEEGTEVLETNIKLIELRNVSYLRNKKTILKDISIVLNYGEKIAIVGASGSGKTSLMNIISGIYSPTTGKILVNNTDLTSVDRENYRSRFSYISSEPFFLNDSLLNNLHTSLTRGKIMEITKLISILKLDNKISEIDSTMISEGGNDFSSGEKVRIDFLRNLIKDSDISIIDEPFARLDSRNITIIENVINTRMNNNIVIVATHIVEPIRNYDKIIVMDRGRIISVGTDSQLRVTCSTYREIKKAQNQKMNSEVV